MAGMGIRRDLSPGVLGGMEGTLPWNCLVAVGVSAPFGRLRAGLTPGWGRGWEWSTKGAKEHEGGRRGGLLVWRGEWPDSMWMRWGAMDILGSAGGRKGLWAWWVMG